MSKRKFDDQDARPLPAGSSKFVAPHCPVSSIRLFRMLHMEYNNIKLELDVFELDRCPDYVALSYTWDPRPRHTMYQADSARPVQNRLDTRKPLTNFEVVPVSINGGSYTISLHLAGGLHALERVRRGTQMASIPPTPTEKLPNPLWIFVDAICIKQDDQRDKETQIANMSQIFSQAKTVYTWLGRAKYSLPESMSRVGVEVGESFLQIPSLINKMEAYAAEVEARNTTRDVVGTVIDNDVTHQSLLFDTTPRTWECLARIPSIPWFERLWCVQEATLNKEVVVLCGRWSLPWITYVRFVRLISKFLTFPNITRSLPFQLHRYLRAAANERPLLILNLKNPEAGDRSTIRASAVTYIATLVDLIRQSFVLQPLDRVYAVLGLLWDTFKGKVVIDYGEHMRSNYWVKWSELFHAIVSIYPFLSEALLAQATYLQNRSGMPTWCPDLEDNSRSPVVVAKRSYAKAGILNESMVKSVRKATDTYDVLIAPLPGRFMLSATGLSIDRIAQIVDFSSATKDVRFGQSSADLDAFSSGLLKSLSRCEQSVTAISPNSTNVEATVARCMIGNAYGNRLPPEQEILREYRLYKEWLDEIYATSLVANVRSKFVASASPTFASKFLAYAMTCSFFVTSSGRAGMTSSRVAVDDQVCLIIGLGKPYVLHYADEKEDFFDFVGEAYVDGIMNGEALPQGGQIESQIREFKIK